MACGRGSLWETGAEGSPRGWLWIAGRPIWQGSRPVRSRPKASPWACLAVAAAQRSKSLGLKYPSLCRRLLSRTRLAAMLHAAMVSHVLTLSPAQPTGRRWMFASTVDTWHRA